MIGEALHLYSEFSLFSVVLCFDPKYTRTHIPTFRRNILIPFSGLLEAGNSSSISGFRGFTQLIIFLPHSTPYTLCSWINTVVCCCSRREGETSLWTATTNRPFVHLGDDDYGPPRWNDIDRGKPKNSEIKLSQCHFDHHKSHMDWPGRKPRPLRWEASN
jgi:hypothetical protein